MPSESPKPRVLCIVGPTASGKSELAQVVSERHGGEVVSADSMQVYRGMDVGTGKVAPSDRRVAHHCLDLVEPGAAYSASLFQVDARRALVDVSSRGLLPVLCGGTGFYVRAAVDDYRFPEGEQVGNPVRDKYLAMADELGPQAVWEELDRIDPRSAAAVHPNNVKRVVRALEMAASGVSYADQVEALKAIPPYFPVAMVGLSVEREVLYGRINDRVDEMVRNGLVGEVDELLGRGYRDGLTAQQAIGYKEIVDYLDGSCTLSESVERIKMATRRYAKRQISWFRGDPRVRWLDATDYDAGRLADQAWEIWEGSDGPSKGEA